jgi:hypothetical protein
MQAEILAAPSRGAASLWRWTAAAAIASLAVIAALHFVGTGRRVAGPSAPIGSPAVRAVLVRTDADVLATWRAQGVQGRTMVHVGRFLHFVSEPGARTVVATLDAPGRAGALDDVLTRQSGPRDYLWVAGSTGVARRILYVEPGSAIDRRLSDLGFDRAALPFPISSRAFPRTLLAELPRVDEPVLLDVNASWFDEGTAEELLAMLRGSALRADLVTLSLAEDADDVTAAARDRMRAFASAFAPGGAEVAP